MRIAVLSLWCQILDSICLQSPFASQQADIIVQAAADDTTALPLSHSTVSTQSRDGIFVETDSKV